MARYSYLSRNYREMINAISVKKELEAGTIQGVNKDVILFQVRSPANPELNDGLFRLDSERVSSTEDNSVFKGHLFISCGGSLSVCPHSLHIIQAMPPLIGSK